MSDELTSWVKNQQLWVFFILAYAISWLLWSPLVANALGWTDIPLPSSWHFLGSMGPLLAAFIVTAAVILTAVIIGRVYGPENYSPLPRQTIG